MLRLLLGVLALSCVVFCLGEGEEEAVVRTLISGPAVNKKWRLKEAKALAWFSKYFGDSFDCDLNCTYNSGADSMRFACTSQGNLVPNSLCSSGKTSIDCHSGHFKKFPDNEYAIVAPSSCICPNDCSLRGSCVFGGCECAAGYTGADCTQLTCGEQKCNGRGTCETMDDLDIQTCVCEENYATNDCSAELEELPPIPNLLGVDQYSSWDQYGDNNPIFNESTIAQIYITIDPSDLLNLILPSNQDQRIYKHANFSFYNGPTTQRFDDVGFRIKGGASRSFAKKSWKISFSTFDDDRKWAQQKKISLKAAGMDPSYLRERASLASIRSMGGPSQRSSYANLYINGQYWGIYIILEEAGSNQFLKSRFGNSDGSLWKVTNGCALKYLGSDQEPYRNSTKYEAMNDGAEDSYEPLINLIDILNNCPDDQFETQIQTVLNVEFFLRTLAAEVATANWDGSWNGNNYYLYYNTDNLFYYYRYDVDVAFGTFEEWFHGSNRNIWTWGQKWAGRRLINRILSVASFQDMYSDYLSKVIEYTKWDENGDYTKRLEIMHQELTPSAKIDNWHNMDQVGFSYSEFENNLYAPVIRPNTYPPQGVMQKKDVVVTLGISEFLEERVSTIKKQLAEGPPGHY